jgi:cytoskeleton-associated protein 5
VSGLSGPISPQARPKNMLPSRLAPPESRMSTARSQIGRPPPRAGLESSDENNYSPPTTGGVESWRHGEPPEEPDVPSSDPASDITLTISNVLSSDSDRSVDALKKVQKILQLGPDAGPSSPEYQDLAEHTEGLIETITLQMSHAFDRPERHIRLAKHLIQTLNAFCDNPVLAESLTVDIFTALLEELAMRLLQTDDSPDKEVKNLSRFINMIMLRLFSTGRRITIFR